MQAAMPKLFISYSWSNPEHEQWVLTFATRLRDNGVDAILDKWRLREGQDAHAFMEQMVTDPTVTKVAVICDRTYSERADRRRGGVGIESQIMSSEVCNKVEQTKFVAIATEKDALGQAYLPTFFKSKLYIDLSPDADFDVGLEKVLRWCFDKPFYIEPVIGTPPSFDDNKLSPVLAIGTAVSMLAQARNVTPQNMIATTRRFFEALEANLSTLGLDFGESENHDDAVIAGVESCIPLIKQMFHVITESMPYDNNDEIGDLVHHYLELIIGRFDEGQFSWSGDLRKFFAHFVLVYYVGVLIKYKRFGSVTRFLDEPFVYARDGSLTAKAASYENFRAPMQSLESRNSRLKLNRWSLHADLIKEICDKSGLSFQQFLQADFILYVRSILVDNADMWSRWYPLSLVYAANSDGALPLFVHAQSKSIREEILKMVGLSTIEGAKKLVAVTRDPQQNVKFNYHSLPSIRLANLNMLYPDLEL